MASFVNDVVKEDGKSLSLESTEVDRGNDEGGASGEVEGGADGVRDVQQVGARYVVVPRPGGERLLVLKMVAYQMMALLYEIGPAFEQTWIEGLGDLGRYRMAIGAEEIRERDTWAGIMWFYYSKANGKSSITGRLYRRFAILVRSNALQQPYYCTCAMTLVKPFPSARETMYPLVPFHQREVEGGSIPDHLLEDYVVHSQIWNPTCFSSDSLPIGTSFVQMHAVFLGRFSPEAFEEAPHSFLSELDHIGRVTVKCKEQGVHVAVATLAGFCDYESDKSIRRLFDYVHDPESEHVTQAALTWDCAVEDPTDLMNNRTRRIYRLPSLTGCNRFVSTIFVALILINLVSGAILPYHPMTSLSTRTVTSNSTSSDNGLVLYAIITTFVLLYMLLVYILPKIFAVISPSCSLLSAIVWWIMTPKGLEIYGAVAHWMTLTVFTVTTVAFIYQVCKNAIKSDTPASSRPARLSTQWILLCRFFIPFPILFILCLLCAVASQIVKPDNLPNVIPFSVNFSVSVTWLLSKLTFSTTNTDIEERGETNISAPTNQSHTDPRPQRVASLPNPDSFAITEDDLASLQSDTDGGHRENARTLGEPRHGRDGLSPCTLQKPPRAHFGAFF